MRKPNFSQAAALVRLVSESGMNLELVQRVLIERWDVIRDFARCLHAGLVSEDLLKGLKESLGPASTQWYDLVCKQATFYYNSGWRETLGNPSFLDYKKECPQVPEELRSYDQDFPYLVLVDERPGFEAMCDLLKVDVSEVKSIAWAGGREPYWIRCQDGWRYRDRNSVKLQKRLNKKYETALTLAEALCLAAQYPRALRDVDMDILQAISDGEVFGFVLTRGSSGQMVLYEVDNVSEMAGAARYGLATRRVYLADE